MKPRRLPVVLLGSLALTAYFAHHAVNGAHGLSNRSRLVERSIEIDREIKALEAVRGRLRQDTRLLSAEPPDADLVEEIARDVLGWTRPGDLIVRRR